MRWERGYNRVDWGRDGYRLRLHLRLGERGGTIGSRVEMLQVGGGWEPGERESPRFRQRGEKNIGTENLEERGGFNV